MTYTKRQKGFGFNPTYKKTLYKILLKLYALKLFQNIIFVCIGKKVDLDSIL